MKAAAGFQSCVLNGPPDCCSLAAPFQRKYKQDGLRSLSQSLYSQLAETAETQLAKSLSELQSEVRLLLQCCEPAHGPHPPFFPQSRYREAGRKEAEVSLFHQLPETLQTLHAREASRLQSQVHTAGSECRAPGASAWLV